LLTETTDDSFFQFPNSFGRGIVRQSGERDGDAVFDLRTGIVLVIIESGDEIERTYALTVNDVDVEN
jgi:hypothetical protein